VNQAAREEKNNLRAHPNFQFSAGYAHFLFDLGPAFTADIKFRGKVMGGGLRTYVTDGLFQIEGLFGVYIPIEIKKVAITPYGDIGMGFMMKKPNPNTPLWFNPGMGISFNGGLMFTTAAVPGLYLQTAYQFNAYGMLFGKSNWDPHIIAVGVGYCFNF